MYNPTFPIDARHIKAYRSNPAIRLYGNRFSADQTSIELLSEFLLVVSSRKRIDEVEFNSALPSMNILREWENVDLEYSPKIRLNLKLFSFLSASKLDTRHISHRKQYSFLVNKLAEKIKTNEWNKRDMIKALESFLLGFQGAGLGRTWCAQSFIPISKNLIVGESIWNETYERRNPVTNWEQVTAGVNSYFSLNRHRFFARGGELFYLQICNALSQDNETIQDWAKEVDLQFTQEELNPDLLLRNLDSALSGMFDSCPKFVDDLAEFIDEKLDYETSRKTDMRAGYEPRYVNAGWCNKDSWQEGYLFAVELNRMLRSGMDVVETIYALDTLFTMHTLRSLIIQAARTLSDDPLSMPEYYFAITDPNEENSTLKRISHWSLKAIEKTIYLAIRKLLGDEDEAFAEKILNEADTRSGHKFFLRLAKNAGIVVPKRGPWARFVMTPQVLQVLVNITIPVGGRITYDTFKELVRKRWGIVFDEDGYGLCSKWLDVQKIYLSSTTDDWLMEMLSESGLLMQLSDSCAMVLHPNRGFEED
jgi:hypothetical protein